MPLQHKHRPTLFKHMVGNASVVRSLQSVLKRKEEVPQAFLFTGPAGIGKTTFAEIVARKMKCEGLDFCEMDAADLTGVDTIRDIRRRMWLAPSQSPKRGWFLDECHRLSNEAQDALLKALEKPPRHVFFILATTNPEKLKASLKRRCSTYDLSPLTEEEMKGLLQEVIKKEKKSVPSEIVEQIVEDSMGSPGIALSVLDNIIDLSEENMKTAARRQAEQKNETLTLCRALLQGASWQKVAPLVKTIQEQPEGVRRKVLGYMASVMSGGGKMSHRAYLVASSFAENFYNTDQAGLYMACYEATEGAK